MAQVTLDLRGLPKAQAYRDLEQHFAAIMEGLDDEIAGMATLSCLLHHGFGHLWTGFYRVVTPEKLLRVGPYQGTLGCLEITFGRGVCGAAAAKRESVVVPDVHAFAGHITCDARSASEIVVPIFGKGGALIAVLDIDSSVKAAFDDEDRVALERIVRWFLRSGSVATGAP